MSRRQRFYFFGLAVAFLMAAACSSATPTPSTMVGYWMDNDNNATTIKYENGEYYAYTTYAMFASRSQNSLVSTNYENGVLSWKYCPPAKPCISMQTVSFNGDTLDVTWANENGESGVMTLTRTDQGENGWH